MTPHDTLKIATVTLTAIVLAGCATGQRDSFTVGSVPDDYRTRHAIILSEAEKNLDIPVSTSAHKLPEGVLSNIRGFAANFARSSSGMIYVLMPAGSANSSAADAARPTVVAALKEAGTPDHKIMVQSYDASNHGATAPIRLAFKEIAASTNECGQWPDDVALTSENKQYYNFGCATQSNMAAMIENPGDLMGPRAQTPIDATRRGAVYEEYIAGN